MRSPQWRPLLNGSEHPVPDADTSRRPWADRVLWAAAALWVLTLLPSLVSILPADVTFRYADEFSDGPMLLFAAVLFFVACRTASHKREASFWGLLMVGLVATLGVRLLYALIPLEVWEAQSWPDIIQDSLYLTGYFVVAYVLERRPDRTPPRGPHGALQQLEVLGALLFVTGLVGYFIVLPSIYSPETYYSWVPSMALYAILDLYVVARAAVVLAGPVAEGWRWPYRWILATYALFFVADLVEGLMHLDVVPWTDPGTPWDVLWHVPMLTWVLIERSRRWPSPAPHAADEDPETLLSRAGPGPSALVGMAFALPAVHFLLGVLGIRTPDLDGPRDVLMLAVLLGLAGLVAHHHRLVRRIASSLQADRQLVSEQLQVAQRMEAVGRLASGVAHDFANILSVIRGRAELLLMTGRVRDAGREDTEEVVEAARRGQSLVRHLLTMSSRKPSEPEILDIDAILAEFAPLLRRVLPESIDIRIAAPGDQSPLVQSERSQIEQTLLNLVVNARDAMSEGGSLSVSTRVEEVDDRYAAVHGGTRGGEFAILRVADTGRGIAPELRTRVFEPFFTTKDEDAGTGLGLAIVYGVARQAGGFVRIVDVPGGGTAFEVHFPKASGPLSEADTTDPAGSGRGRETVLVVEDYDALRRTTARMLSEAGYRVLQAGNAGEALSILERRNETVEVMLVDLLLPDLPGFQLARRAKERLPSLVAVFMTGHPDALPPDVDVEAYTIVQKPFSPELLTLAIRRAVDEGRAVVN